MRRRTRNGNHGSRLYTWFGRWSAWGLRLLVVITSLVVLFMLLWVIPTPYYITAPGAAIDTSRLITVPGGTAHRANLFMLVLNTDQANLFWYLEAKLDKRTALQTKTEFMGDVPDYAKYLELSQEMMTDSEKTAKAIALQAVGRGQGVQAVGAEITDLGTGSPATGILAKGDVVIGANGKKVASAADLQAIMKGVKPGDKVAVQVRRGSQELTLSVPTVENPAADRKGTAAFMVFIKDSLHFDLPVDVKIQPGAISGPSAGLMFTLQIIDQLTPGGLAPGKIIAGTGTINYDGSVGPIGGVQQKVYTAEAAGASVMFVPKDNYADAAKVATQISLVSVATYKDALQWLAAHR